MYRVALFCDWFEDSRRLIDRLKMQTIGFEGDQFRDITFVDDDSFTHAVIFNYTGFDWDRPAISLILEPPEIYPIRENPPSVKTYSFCDDGHLPAYGIGLATCSAHVSYHHDRNRMAMICSDKLLTDYHHKRQEIKNALANIDIDIHFYGRGMPTGGKFKGEIPSMRKDLVLPQYQFVIDFENSPANVVTDKYFDPILCSTVPITNSQWIAQNHPDSCEFVSFDWTVDDIVEKIWDIYEKADYHSYYFGVRLAYHEIVFGSMCLARWIEERVKEL